MNTRCRPGQLAKVIHSISPINLRRLVYVVERCYANEDGIFLVDGVPYDSKGYAGPVWIVESLGEPFFVGGYVEYGHVAPVKDSSLQPLPDLGPETEDTVRTQVVEELTA